MKVGRAARFAVWVKTPWIRFIKVLPRVAGRFRYYLEGGTDDDIKDSSQPQEEGRCVK